MVGLKFERNDNIILAKIRAKPREMYGPTFRPQTHLGPKDWGQNDQFGKTPLTPYLS